MYFSQKLEKSNFGLLLFTIMIVGYILVVQVVGCLKMPTVLLGFDSEGKQPKRKPSDCPSLLSCSLNFK